VLSAVHSDSSTSWEAYPLGMADLWNARGLACVLSLCLFLVSSEAIPRLATRATQSRIDDAAEAAALLELASLTEAELKDVPRCGQEFGNATCTAVGKAGNCCSKWGFCGTKPFHCIPRLGCQSECNTDLDFVDNSEPPEPPIPVVYKPRPRGPRVIIKTIAPATPLCSDCRNETVVRIIEQGLSGKALAMANAAMGVPLIKATKPARVVRKKKHQDVDYRKAVAELRKMTKKMEALARSVMAQKNKKKKKSSRHKYDISMFPKSKGGRLGLRIDIVNPRDPKPKEDDD